MAHELTIHVNGKAEMAYTGDEPWHGLGQKLPDDAPLEVWLQAAGMDWTIQRSRVQYATDRDPSTPLRVMDERFVLMRSDTKAALSVVSDDYNIVQPHVVLEFFRDLVSSGNFKLSTAGTLFGGRRFWALAKIADDLELPGGDIINGNLLLATSCDRSMNSTAKVCGTRVVCNNTLTLAMEEGAVHQVKVSHSTKFNPALVKQQLGVAAEQFALFGEQARALAAMSVTVRDANLYLRDIYEAGSAATERDIANSTAYKKTMDLFTGAGRGSRLPSARHTGWGLFSAVTEYADHFARAKSVDHRLSSAWFGKGEEVKQHAFAYLCERAA